MCVCVCMFAWRGWGVIYLQKDGIAIAVKLFPMLQLHSSGIYVLYMYMDYVMFVALKRLHLIPTPFITPPPDDYARENRVEYWIKHAVD